MINVVLVGAPGSGKGTYASRVSARLNIPAISTGDILREAIRSGTPLGSEVKACVEGGKLVPDDVMARVLSGRLRGDDCGGGCILDGYPRTSPQADELDRVMKERETRITTALVIEIDESIILRRLGGRRSCPKCGSVFNVHTLKPIKEGVCDKCETGLVTRADDQEETVRRRLASYREQSGPLIERYRRAGVVRTVNADGPVDEVVDRIVEMLKTGVGV